MFIPSVPSGLPPAAVLSRGQEKPGKLAELAQGRFREQFDRIETTQLFFGAKRLDHEFRTKPHSGLVMHQNGTLIYCNSAQDQVEFYGAGGQINHVINFHESSIHEPSGVAVDNEGLIYISESSRNRVSIFSPAGEFIRWVAPEGTFITPTGMVINAEGTLFVTETDNHTLAIVFKDGTILRAKGSERYPLHFPVAVALNPRDGNIAVLDEGKILFFSPQGDYLGFFCQRKIEDPSTYFPLPAIFMGGSGLAYDEEGKLLVSEKFFHHIKVYDEGHKYICSFGINTKVGNSSSFSPAGLALNQKGYLFVVNSQESRVFVLEKA